MGNFEEKCYNNCMLSSKETDKNLLRLCLVYFVLFLDFVSFSAVIPLLPPLFFEQKGLLPFASLENRYLLLGALLASYPLAQIFSGPVLGAFSDETSRKRVLLISFAGNCLGYMLVALGVSISSLPLLFAGNIIAGLLGGNIATINAVIADLSTPYTKAKRYGLSNLIFGLAFILGPYIISQFSPGPTALPFLVCALCALGNFFLIYLFFEEKEPSHSFVQWEKHWHFKNLFYCSKSLKKLLLSGFFLFFGWYSFIKFFQVFVLQHFQFSSTQFCELLSYFGLCCVITQSFFVLLLHKWTEPRKFLLFFLALLFLSLLSLFFVQQEYALWIVVTLFSIAYSLIAPCFMAVVSNSEEKEAQGKAMGLYQSVQALSKVIAPAATGAILTFGTETALLVSSTSILASGFLFFFVKNRENISVSS